MLDIKFIRENAEIVKDAARKKHMEVDIDLLLKKDDERRDLMQKIEEIRAEQNKMSGNIVREKDQTAREQMIMEMTTVKNDLTKFEEDLKPVMIEWKKLMLTVPNVPDMSVPEGDDDADNQEIKTWGEKPTFDFEPKTHIELMLAHDMADFERGTKVSGFRGYYLKNGGALLTFAIWSYAVEFFTNKGLSPMLVPSLVNRETLFGSGYLPQGEDDLYKTQDGDYLAGTAEVATMAYHSGEILEKEKLPLKFLSFSTCFRREAGSHAKDVKGLIRVHEFYKFEQVVICEATHEQSVKYHEELERNTEEFIESLGIPYRTVVNCGGDLGLGQVKKYDIELWVPKEEKYREISSASYFHDFQARRLNIRYKNDEGKTSYVHSLNSTAIPTPRILVSLIENFQQADGRIKLPEVLKKYFPNSAKQSNEFV